MTQLNKENLDLLCKRTKEGIKAQYGKDLLVNWQEENNPSGPMLVVTIHGENVGDQDTRYVIGQDQHGAAFMREV